MQRLLPGDFRQIALLLILSLAGVCALFVWQSHTGLNLADEGFLWYGAQRVVMGEVPMRDFMAYDIGRYYWSAAFMSLLGSKGIVALRAAIAAFEIIALFVGLLVLTRSSVKQNFIFWLLAVMTLLVWMAPQHKVFDIGLSIILVGAFSFLVETPSGRRYFLAGLAVGFAAIFGRNHGVYGLIGGLGVIAYLAIRREGGTNLTTAFKYWLLGIVVGYLPMLVFLVVVPGFAQAFWDSVLVLFEIKATNIPLPVPWPWLVSIKTLPVTETFRYWVKGTFFVAILAFGLFGIVWLIRKKLQKESAPSVLIASVFLALPYVHYAYSRADINHLACGIPPFLMGIFALLASKPAKIKWALTVLVCGASLFLVLPSHFGWICHVSQRCADYDVAGDKLRIERNAITILSVHNQLAEQFALDNRTFVSTPYLPGVYAAFERKSPMWEIYALFPRSVTSQQAEIEKIKAANPGFVVVDDFALDGRDELRFRNTHPIIDQYIRDNFVPLKSPSPLIRIYRNKLVE